MRRFLALALSLWCESIAPALALVAHSTYDPNRQVEEDSRVPHLQLDSRGRPLGNDTAAQDWFRTKQELRSILKGCRGYECMEKYVKFDDGQFAWRATKKATSVPWHGTEMNIYVLEVQSLQWHHDRHQYWLHVVEICQPTEMMGDLAAWVALLIHDPKYTDACQWAKSTGAATAIIHDVPNANLNFIGDDSAFDQEEYIKARGWKGYATDPDEPDALIEMPSVKAVLRAIDAIQAYSREHMSAELSKFVLMGASKRAMSAYHACALDPGRVKAIVPEDMKLRFGRQSGVSMAPRWGTAAGMKKPRALLKAGSGEEFEASLRYQRVAFEDFEYLSHRALKHRNPYADLGLGNLTVEEYQRLYSIVDPYTYLGRLSCGPKLVQNAGEDMWFFPDGSRRYLADLSDATFQMVGSSTHDPFHVQHVRSAQYFVGALMRDLELPKIRWSISLETGDISAEQLGHHKPTHVRVWRGHAPRLGSMGPAIAGRGPARTQDDFSSGMSLRWEAEEIMAVDGETVKAGEPGSPDQESAAGQRWLAAMPPEEEGKWSLMYVEFEYKAYNEEVPEYKITTELSMWPNDEINYILKAEGMIEEVEGADGSSHLQVVPSLTNS